MTASGEGGYLGGVTGPSADSFEVLRSTRCRWSLSRQPPRQVSPQSFGIRDDRSHAPVPDCNRPNPISAASRTLSRLSYVPAIQSRSPFRYPSARRLSRLQKAVCRQSPRLSAEYETARRGRNRKPLFVTGMSFGAILEGHNDQYVKGM